MFRKAAALAIVTSFAAPTALAATGGLPLPDGSPWWLGWLLAGGASAATFVVYAVGRTAARAIAAALEARADQLEAHAKSTPTTDDDGPAAVKARALRAAADEIKRTAAGGQKGGE